MTSTTWPPHLFELIMIPRLTEVLQSLADLAEPEEWDYQHTPSDHPKPILHNYLKYTYRKLAEEDKIVVADDGRSIAFNTGLVTPNQESIFCYCVHNHLPDVDTPWHFNSWRRTGEHELTKFSILPEMANYYAKPASLVFDTQKELRVNVDHVIADNKQRFPAPHNEMNDYALQTFLKGAIDNAKERVRRNYKTAIPQYFRGRIQLLLPLCLGNPSSADLAIVAEDHGSFYRAATCLTLDMAYNNARQLARPDRDWLTP